MFWYIFISLIILFLFWLMLMPVILYADTTRNRYVLTLPGVIKIRLVPSETLFYLRAWIFFIPFRFDPFQARKGKKPREKKKKRRRSSFKVGGLGPVLGAIRIRKLKLDVDTEDFSLNAWLIPALSLANGGNIDMQVNFLGKLSLVLDLRTRIGTLLWNYSRYRYQLLTIKHS